MLYGASLMPNLLVLDASDQALSGHLSAVQIPTLEVLDLSNNSIQVRHRPHLLTLRQSSKAESSHRNNDYPVGRASNS